MLWRQTAAVVPGRVCPNAESERHLLTCFAGALYGTYEAFRYRVRGLRVYATYESCFWAWLLYKVKSVFFALLLVVTRLP